MADTAEISRAAASPWKWGGLRAGQLGRRVWAGFNRDNLLGRAAELAYSFFFALFPMLIFLVGILGAIARNNPSIRTGLIHALTSAMPGTASGLVTQVVQQTTSGSGKGLLSFGIVLALISASSGVTALMDTLNDAYDVKEGRSFLRYRGIATALTIGIGILIVASVVVILYGNGIVKLVAGNDDIGPVAKWAWMILQWPIAILFLLLAYSLVYYYAPDVDHPAWHWITPGSAVGVLLSLVISFAFRAYIHYFNTFNQTYGSLGAVMILLLWFYVMGLAILIGGEVNSVIEHAAAEHGSDQGIQRGHKQPVSEEHAA